MIVPGSIIGIIGGGQLGRMMACAAASLGYRVHIYTPERDSPASEVAFDTTVAPYDDKNALSLFAGKVDIITFEFENVPHECLELLEGLKPVAPSASTLKICRNRVREKTFINDQAIATTDFRRATSLAELEAAARALGFPAIVKTTELGYDGKGQVTLDGPDGLRPAWKLLHSDEVIVEARVDFVMEISVIVARSAMGEIRTFPPVQNIHKHHILDTTIAPAVISDALARQAGAIAVTLSNALGLRGLLAVEMFVTRDGRLLVNELAPRPHNSGHWTMDACVTGQFEQAVRAVCGLPLGSTDRLADAQMKNLIGAEVDDWEQYLKNPDAKLHLYGKKETRPGRKMGHVTTLKTRSQVSKSK